MLLRPLPLLFALVSSALAYPAPDRVHIVGRAQSAKANESDFDILYQGNQDFRATHADSIKKLSTGQAPKFLFLGCSDSRVPEGTVFNAKPGTFFAERNIANLFEQQDNNVKAIVSYGVEHLHVKHIIVMGHYGCGGVQAAIASPPPLPWDEATTSIQTWIKPIRKLYQTSNRREIVELRERNEGEEEVAGPPTHDPGFRALVEENVKSTVSNIVRSKIIAQHFSPSHPNVPDLYVHGWVYDIDNGEVRDLGVSVGPPGKAVPPAPFMAVEAAVEYVQNDRYD
ncbi:carbonic anhydrase [Coprinopsis cinerea AmutBmut pab1-1]|nr:carbonic anhydrase [Coprinopsis cinerea AmutBmut pab1-1]